MKQIQVDTDYLETLTKRLADLERRVVQLENNATPTVPIYDNTNLPVNAVEGQVAIA